MATRKSGRVWRPALLLMTLLPGWALGEHSAEERSSLVLELRYCECAVIDPAGPQGALPKAFLEQSNLLRADVAHGESGSVSSDDVTLTFEVRAVEDSPGDYRFNYSGTFAPNTGVTESQADLIVSQGQWVPLFQTGHEDEAVFGAAARLVNSGGS